MLLAPIVDVRSLLQLAQEIHKLHVVELLVQRFVLLIRQLQTLYVLQGYRQVIVIPRIVDAPKDLVRYSDLGQNQEEPFRSFEYPFHVGIVGQPFSKSEWPVEEPAFFTA